MKKTLLLAFCLMALGACDVSTPSQIGIGQIRLQESVRTEVVDVHAVDLARVNILSDDYQRNGEGGMRLIVSYLNNGRDALVTAQKQGEAYRKAFAHRGVSSLDISYVATSVQEEAGVGLVSYTVLAALPPEKCKIPIPGSQGSETVDNAMAYEIGCENQAALSRMISQPRDLEGRGGTPDGDSRRQSEVVEKYRSGEPNEKIEGFNASEIAAGGGG